MGCARACSLRNVISTPGLELFSVRGAAVRGVAGGRILVEGAVVVCGFRVARR
jgi:hypothetical protein